MLTVHRFSEIAPADWVRLLNNPEVHRHMPLGGGDKWTEAGAADWAAGKDAQWASNGYGPWALKLDGTFAGWGGFQKENADADFGLVLLPEFWGHGMAIGAELLARGWDMGLPSVRFLLPPSRRMRGLGRLGFKPDGEVDYDGHRFLRFRIDRP
jgi:RimJ/RimL family protein N-acetyltransferase